MLLVASLQSMAFRQRSPLASLALYLRHRQPFSSNSTELRLFGVNVYSIYGPGVPRRGGANREGEGAKILFCSNWMKTKKN